MEVWAGMKCKFNAARYPQLNINKESNIYNPFEKSSYHFLFSLYEEILRVHNPSAFLIGHDEIKGLSTYVFNRPESTSDILTMDIKKIYKWLTLHGIDTVMWGDMFLEKNKWKEQGAANSGNPVYNSGITHETLNNIPKDIKILDWHYSEKSQYTTINYFRKKGFRVYGSPWHDPKAAKVMAESVKVYNGQGIIVTDWGLWSTLSPAATTLYSGLCGWFPNLDIDSEDEDVVALAALLRESEYRKLVKHEPISMDKKFNETTYDSHFSDGNGVFDLGPALDLRWISVGNVILGGVSFRLLDPKEGKVKNCLVVGHDKTSRESLKREEELIIDRKKVKAIAFLHTCYVEKPQYRPRIIGTYVFKYEDGWTTSLELIEGWNITDVRSIIGLRDNPWSFGRCPDVLIGSELVWRGQSGAGIPLNLQMMVWKNPHPEKNLISIQIKSANIGEDLRIAVPGITILN